METFVMLDTAAPNNGREPAPAKMEAGRDKSQVKSLS